MLFNKYIKPKHAKEWPGAEKINHISPGMVEHCKNIDAYVPKIQKIIDRSDVIVGYNQIHFDCPILEAAGINFRGKKQVDVFVENRDDYPKWPKLTQMAKDNGYYFVPHDSLEDCKATLHIFNKTYNQRSEKKGKEQKDNNISGSSLQIIRTILLFLLGIALFFSLSYFGQNIVKSDPSIYLAMMVSVICCIKLGLIAAPITGPLYYLVYQLILGHSAEWLFSFVTILAVSIFLKIFIVFVKKIRNKISVYISGTAVMLISAGLFYLIRSLRISSQSVSTALIVFLGMEFMFLISVFKESISAQ